jgi:hypothetical protein
MPRNSGRWGKATGEMQAPIRSYRTVPLSLARANEFVEGNHRHHGRVVGHKFAIAAIDATGRIRGVVIVGRPVARNLDDGLTLEVNRLCVDITGRNLCSFLYSAARRAAFDLGCQRIVTYILASAPGVSRRVGGWVKSDIVTPGGSWESQSRIRNDPDPIAPKTRYESSAPGSQEWGEVLRAVADAEYAAQKETGTLAEDW